MKDVKFCDFKPTPNEKHVGIATVLIDNIIFLRYKITSGKNGGYFPNAPSYKIVEYGQDSYIPGFLIESNMLKEQVESIIRSNVNRIMSSGQQNSIFAAPGYTGSQMAQPAQQMPQANYEPVQQEIPLNPYVQPSVAAVLNSPIDSDEIPF